MNTVDRGIGRAPEFCAFDEFLCYDNELGDTEGVRLWWGDVVFWEFGRAGLWVARGMLRDDAGGDW